jgi:hypothetical protein
MATRELTDNWKVEMEILANRVDILEAWIYKRTGQWPDPFAQPQLQPQQQPQPVSVEAIAGAIATPVGAPPLTVENLGQG